MLKPNVVIFAIISVLILVGICMLFDLRDDRKENFCNGRKRGGLNSRSWLSKYPTQNYRWMPWYWQYPRGTYWSPSYPAEWSIWPYGNWSAGGSHYYY